LLVLTCGLCKSPIGVVRLFRRKIMIFLIDNARFCGFLGTIFFSLFYILCTFRLYATLKHPSTKGQGRRSIFHLALMASSSFELIFSITLMIYDTFIVFGYSFHIAALFCNIVAFFISAYHWWSIVLSPDQKWTLKRILISVGFINLVATIIEVVNIGYFVSFYDNTNLHYLGTATDFEYGRGWSYIMIISINAISLCLLSMCLMIYASYLKSRLVVTTTTNIESSLISTTRSSVTSRSVILIRLHGIFGLCVVAYFSRVVLLLLAIFVGSSVHSFIPLAIWLLFSSWFPVIGPVSL
jgi:hypothetical protein